MPISGESGVIACRLAVRSTTCAAIAMPAASSAMRNIFRTGNQVCGEISRMMVKASNA